MTSIFRSEPSKIVCTCSPGIAPILAREMADLGFRPGDVLESAVETEGTLADCLRLNMHLRTAHRVLYALDVFRARNGEDLYGFTALPMGMYMPKDVFGYRNDSLYATFWTATESSASTVHTRGFSNEGTNAVDDVDDKANALPVRCVKN